MSEATRPRIALVQTQAENAGAQEISRLIAADLAARGYDVRQLFFFRRTASFDTRADVEFFASERDDGLAGVDDEECRAPRTFPDDGLALGKIAFLEQVRDLLDLMLVEVREERNALEGLDGSAC